MEGRLRQGRGRSGGTESPKSDTQRGIGPPGVGAPAEIPLLASWRRKAVAESRDAVQGASGAPARLIQFTPEPGTDCSGLPGKRHFPVYHSAHASSIEQAIGRRPLGTLLSGLSPTDCRGHSRYPLLAGTRYRSSKADQLLRRGDNRSETQVQAVKQVLPDTTVPARAAN